MSLKYKKLPSLISLKWVRKHFQIKLSDEEVERQIEILNENNVVSVVDLHELDRIDLEQMGILEEMKVILMNTNIEKQLQVIQERLQKIEEKLSSIPSL